MKNMRMLLLSLGIMSAAAISPAWGRSNATDLCVTPEGMGILIPSDGDLSGVRALYPPHRTSTQATKLFLIDPFVTESTDETEMNEDDDELSVAYFEVHTNDTESLSFDRLSISRSREYDNMYALGFFSALSEHPVAHDSCVTELTLRRPRFVREQDLVMGPWEQLQLGGDFYPTTVLYRWIENKEGTLRAYAYKTDTSSMHLFHGAPTPDGAKFFGVASHSMLINHVIDELTVANQRPRAMKQFSTH